MTEEGQEVIVLQNNKKETTDKGEDKNKYESKVDINNYNSEALDSKGNLNASASKNEQLEFNQKDIYELSSGAIEKLKISLCEICQSKDYSIFIPETVDNIPNQDEKPQDQMTENENQTQKITEGDYIKPNKNQNIFLPVMICKQNHQTCLICNKPPHINTLCDLKSTEYYDAVEKLNFIKENIPEKSDIIESMKQALFAIFKKTDKESYCNCKCCCKCLGISILIFIWTIISIILFVFGIVIVGLIIGFHVLCCVYHCCYELCCTVTVHDEDKGDHILRVTTYHRDREAQNKREAEDDAEAIDTCGAFGLNCVFSSISWGYTKICALRD